MTAWIRLSDKTGVRQALEDRFLGPDTPEADRPAIVEAIRVAVGHLADRKQSSYYSDHLDCKIVTPKTDPP